MVSKNRRIEPGYSYHVLNRGVQRQTLFTCDAEYLAFEDLLQDTLRRIPLVIYTYELMPNHWHFVVRAGSSKDEFSEFFQYLTATHAKRFQARHNTVGTGHVYQDRFKSFPVQSDEHFLTLCRYVERNALRAGFVERAEQWRWGGLWRRLHQRDAFLVSDWPVARPAEWVERVNQPLTPEELAAIRTSIRRGSPFGDSQWTQQVAIDLGLTHTLRRIGRPRKCAPAARA